MAVINPTWVNLNNAFGNEVVVYTWTPLAASDTGAPVQGPGWADRCAQVSGTFGAGGLCLIEGSNDGTNWFTLNDPFSNALSLAGASLKQITEVPYWIRPHISAGDGTTALTVILVLGRHGQL